MAELAEQLEHEIKRRARFSWRFYFQDIRSCSDNLYLKAEYLTIGQKEKWKNEKDAIRMIF